MSCSTSRRNWRNGKEDPWEKRHLWTNDEDDSCCETDLEMESGHASVGAFNEGLGGIRETVRQ